LDDDGAMDLLFGNIGPDAVLLNNGDGTFVDATSARWPQTVDSRTQDLELFDADNDGDLDLAVGNEGQNQLYLNQNGVFVEVTSSNLPQRDDETREIRAVDIDGDGDLDLAVANVAFITEGTSADYLLLNDGTGNFTESTLAFPEDARSNFTVQTIDIDRDGDADLLLPSTVFPTNEQITYMMATGPDGARHFYHISRFGIDDRDGDGDEDIFTSIDEQEFMFTNEGDDFLLKDAGGVTLVPVEPDKLDFDGNGTNELTIWSSVFNLQNQDDAIFSQNNLEFYDVDDNGSVEVVSVAQSTMSSVGDYLLLLNDGTGQFTRAAPDTYFPASANGNGFDIEVADFNGDALDDMFFCNRASSVDEPVESGGEPRLLLGI
ncbi:MAG: VCBS repeat-containing protein, partial [Pseudomonadota bacterium]